LLIHIKTYLTRNLNVTKEVTKIIKIISNGVILEK